MKELKDLIGRKIWRLFSTDKGFHIGATPATMKVVNCLDAERHQVQMQMLPSGVIHAEFADGSDHFFNAWVQADAMPKDAK